MVPYRLARAARARSPCYPAQRQKFPLAPPAPPRPCAAPTTFSNLFFTELKDNKWNKRKWDGPLQFEDKSKTLMMLNTDM